MLKDLFKREGLRRYFFNTSWMMSEQIIKGILGLVATLLIARYLGPARFGLLSYAISFVFLFSILVDLGMESLLVRDLVRLPEETDDLLGSAFLLKIAGATVAWLGLGVSAVLIPSHTRLTDILIGLVALGLVFQPFKVIEYLFLSTVTAKEVARAKIVQSFVIFAAKLALVILAAPLVLFAGVAALEQILLAAGYLIVYKRTGRKIRRWAVRPATVKRLLISSLPLLVSGLAVTIYMRIDQIMIKNMLDNTAVGLYAAAVKLCESVYILPVVLTASLYPAVVGAKGNDEALYYSRLQVLYDMMVISGLLITVPLALFARPLVLLLFGANFAPAAATMQIYIWAGLFVFLGCASSKWFVTEGLLTLNMYLVLIGAVSNVVLNLFLIPVWGIKGAAVATVVSYALSAYFSMLLFPKTKRNFILATKSFNLVKAVRRILAV